MMKVIIDEAYAQNSEWQEWIIMCDAASWSRSFQLRDMSLEKCSVSKSFSFRAVTTLPIKSVGISP